MLKHGKIYSHLFTALVLFLGCIIFNSTSAQIHAKTPEVKNSSSWNDLLKHSNSNLDNDHNIYMISITSDYKLDQTHIIDISEHNYQLNMNGHTIDGNNINGPAIKIINSGTEKDHYIEIKSFGRDWGTIKGSNNVNGNGGGIYVDDGVALRFADCTVTSNKAKLGGGIYVEKGGRVEMLGGTICNNDADEGGGIYVAEGGELLASGGTITGNTAGAEYPAGKLPHYKGGGVRFLGYFGIKESPVIKGNTADGKPSNVDIYETENKICKHRINFPDGCHMNHDAYVGIGNTDTGYGEICDGYYNNGEIVHCFVCDDPNYDVIPSTMNKQVVPIDEWLRFYCQNAWYYDEPVKLRGDCNILNSGSDPYAVTVKRHDNFRESYTVIDLNGHNLNLIGDNPGGFFYIDQDTTFKIIDTSPDKSGTINGGKGSLGGAVFISKNGNFIFEGGIINNNTASTAGGGIYVDSGGTLTMTGGIIRDNAAPTNKGSDIFANSGSTVNISGNSIISQLCLCKSKINVAGKLTNKTPIGITLVSDASGSGSAIMTGAFTSGLKGNGSSSDFQSVDPDYYVKEDASGEACIYKKSVSDFVTRPTVISGLTYNKNAQYLITAGSSSDGDILYAVTKTGAAAPKDEDYGKDIPTALYAGSYTVYYKISGNNEHLSSDVYTLTAVINKGSIPDNAPSSHMKVIYTTAKVLDVQLPDGWQWKNNDQDNKLDVLRAVKATAQYTAADKESYNIVTKSVTITRNPRARKITISPKKAVVNAGKTLKLNVAIYPYDGPNDHVTWKSSDPDIASVNEKGVITAKKKGKVTITATAKDGSKVKDTCRITVKPTTSKLILSPSMLTLKLKGKVSDKRKTVSVKVSPSLKTTGEALKLSIPKKGKKIVSASFNKSTGKITVAAKAKGSTVITVKVGNITSRINVSVT